MRTYIAHGGESVDEVCFLVFGKVYGVYEEVLRLNPHITGRGDPLNLKEGERVNLPDKISEVVEKKVRLWD